MLFCEPAFFVFLLIVFCLYYLPLPRLGKGYQVSILLLGSAVFYGWEEPWLLLLLLGSCLGNSLFCLSILRQRQQGRGQSVRRRVISAVALNLLLLVCFKYAGLLGGLLPLPEAWTAWLRDIPLPIGISFYTFHGISLVIDTAKVQVRLTDGTEPCCGSGLRRLLHRMREVGLYLLFFPQLIAGPLVRASQFRPQIAGKRFRDIAWGAALRFLLLGYFLKMVCADNLAEFTPYLENADYVAQMGTLQLLSLFFAYSFQIFADYGGYSFIAIGLAMLFGYRLPDNFNFPYLSTSITEFWRRWNMTLSAWLRDYLYIPLGGNRKGAARTYTNLFLVMLLGGLWHGAAWKFALWGICHGLLLAAERLIWQKRQTQSRWLKALGGVYCFLTVSLLWMTFLLPDIPALSAFFRGLTTTEVAPMMNIPFAALLYSAPVVLLHLVGWVKEHRPALYSVVRHPWAEGMLYGLMLFLLLNNAGAPTGFIYFQF